MVIEYYPRKEGERATGEQRSTGTGAVATSGARTRTLFQAMIGDNERENR